MKKRALGIIAAVVLAVATVGAPAMADANLNGKNCIGWVFSRTPSPGKGSVVSSQAKSTGGMPGVLAFYRLVCSRLAVD